MVRTEEEKKYVWMKSGGKKFRMAAKRMLTERLFGGSFIRFLAVGVVNTAVGYGTIFAALALGASYAAATLLGTTLGLIVSFTLNGRFTFRYSGNYTAAALKFAAVSYACYLAAFPLTKAALGTWSAPYLTADQTAAAAGCVIYTLLHYFSLRRFVFRSAAGSRRGDRN